MPKEAERLEKIAFEFARRVSKIEKVVEVILFGSVARGEADRRSDIDILVVLDQKGKPKLEEHEEISEIALEVGREFDANISLILSDREFSSMDEYFVESVLSEGKVIYAREARIAEKEWLRPWYILSYSLKELPHSDKMRIKKIFYGKEVKSKHGNRVYIHRYKGLLEEVGGASLGRGCIIFPAKFVEEFEEVLKKYKVKYRKMLVWISEYNVPAEPKNKKTKAGLTEERY